LIVDIKEYKAAIAKQPQQNTLTNTASVIGKILLQHQNAAKNEKARWLSLVSQFKPRTLKEWGFKFSRDQLTRARKITFDTVTVAGRRSISVETIQKVTEYIRKNSSLAANREIQVGRNPVTGEPIKKPVRYVKCCISCLYHFEFTTVTLVKIQKFHQR
jgi:hypothetical protein